MFRQIVFYFNLAILCIRLVWNLVGFASKILLSKIEERVSVNYLLVLLILLSLAANFYVLDRKNQLQVTLIPANKNTSILYPDKSSDSLFLTTAEINTTLDYYQQLKTQKIDNLFDLINLNQLYLAIDNKELAQDYLKQAQQILPTINYQE